MQIKTTMRYYLTPIRMAIIKKKKLQTINLGQDVEKENPLHGLWECKLIYPLWRTVWRFLNKLGITLPCVCLVTQSCPTLCDPMDCSPRGSSICSPSPPPLLDFLGKKTGVGCHFLLQGIFLAQGSNPGLLHCGQTLYRLNHQGIPSTQ